MIIDRNNVMNSTPLSWGSNNDKTEIIIHETANLTRGANAQSHHNLQKRGNSRKASWHYQVDDIKAIQSFSENLQLYHAGTPTNYHSISIEICVNKDGNYDKAVRNAVILAVDIAKRNNIPINKINTHKSATGKQCPRIMLSGNTSWNWNRFKNEVRKGLGSNVSPSKPKPNKSINAMATETINNKNVPHGITNRALYFGISKTMMNEVQREVNNRLSKVSSSKPKPVARTINSIATETINNKNVPHGISKRAKYFGISTSRMKLVQSEVNDRLRSKSKPNKSISYMATEIIPPSLNKHKTPLLRHYSTNGFVCQEKRIILFIPCTNRFVCQEKYKKNFNVYMLCQVKRLYLYVGGIYIIMLSCLYIGGSVTIVSICSMLTL